MLKFNSKANRALYDNVVMVYFKFQLQTYFMSCSGVFSVHFEHVNAKACLVVIGNHVKRSDMH